jgi:murein DD-endopeptidase MepM/ murein hydrolase activator NlpD
VLNLKLFRCLLLIFLFVSCAENRTYHIVIDNETLEEIASEYEVDIADLIEYNTLLHNTNSIYLGLVVWLEGGHQFEMYVDETEPEPEPEEVEVLFPEPEPIIPIIPCKYVRITSEFGRRRGREHTGIDFAADGGTPIYAVLQGIVFASDFVRGGYGNRVIIDHGDGTQTLYAHCSQTVVRKGERVEQGELIGYVGRTRL